MTLQEAQLILNVKEGDTKEHIQAVSSPPSLPSPLSPSRLILVELTLRVWVFLCADVFSGTISCTRPTRHPR